MYHIRYYHGLFWYKENYSTTSLDPRRAFDYATCILHAARAREDLQLKMLIFMCVSGQACCTLLLVLHRILSSPLMRKLGCCYYCCGIVFSPARSLSQTRRYCLRTSCLHAWWVMNRIHSHEPGKESEEKSSEHREKKLKNSQITMGFCRFAFFTFAARFKFWIHPPLLRSQKNHRRCCQKKKREKVIALRALRRHGRTASSSSSSRRDPFFFYCSPRPRWMEKDEMLTRAAGGAHHRVQPRRPLWRVGPWARPVRRGGGSPRTLVLLTSDAFFPRGSRPVLASGVRTPDSAALVRDAATWRGVVVSNVWCVFGSVVIWRG